LVPSDASAGNRSEENLLLRTPVSLLPQLALFTILAGCATAPVATTHSLSHPLETADATIFFPVADHHAHLLSPAGAALISDRPEPFIELPEELRRLLAARAQHWNDPATLAPLYTEDAVVLHAPSRRLVRGRNDVAAFIGKALFGRGYAVTPFSLGMDHVSAHIAGYYTRGEGEAIAPFGQTLLTLQRGEDGEWRIISETALFPGPVRHAPIAAEQRIAAMDDAATRRAVVLSAAFWFGSPLLPAVAGEYEAVRAENDWTAAEAARFPHRLIAFCSVNPLKEYALEEIGRCRDHPHLQGLKLHFANSAVDVKNGKHVEQLRQLFRAANDARLPIAVHLWVPGGEYGREHAEIFLNEILPEAPDVVVQIAHFAGGGPGYTDPALAVYAEAIAAGDRRTTNLYFDIATVADHQSAEVLEQFARRIRQVGLERILFGVDMGPITAIFTFPRGSVWQSWMTFRTTVPLTDDEFRTIANNVAPYLR
jgi:predicted TIM-barrel fold metal-dependent hydrolase